MLVFVLLWLSLHWEILMLLSQSPLTVCHVHNKMPHLITLLMTILVLTETVSVIIWEMFHGRISLNSVLLLLLVNFVESVQVGIDVYISHWKYQVKPLLSLWFSAACGAAIVHRNHFFYLYQKDISSESKVKFRKASNQCKRVLEAAKLAWYANKTKESLTSQKFSPKDFWSIANSVLYKGKSVIPHPFNDWRCCLLHLIKQNCLLKTFLRTLILMTQVSLYLFSLLELIWNCIFL